MEEEEEGRRPVARRIISARRVLPASLARHSPATEEMAQPSCEPLSEATDAATASMSLSSSRRWQRWRDDGAEEAPGTSSTPAIRGINHDQRRRRQRLRRHQELLPAAHYSLCLFVDPLAPFFIKIEAYWTINSLFKESFDLMGPKEAYNGRANSRGT